MYGGIASYALMWLSGSDDDQGIFFEGYGNILSQSKKDTLSYEKGAGREATDTCKHNMKHNTISKADQKWQVTNCSNR